MDRLISEQAVIESIEYFQMNPQHFDFVALIDDIKEIPSADQKVGHWIPVSERLPSEKFEDYLACCSDGYISTIMYDGDNGRWLIDDAEVIAWMPLPKPYEAEGSEKE